MASTASSGVGPLLREWRRRRHRSQLELALDAGVSARHISFLETGRTNPSREMVIGLASNLDVPLRERNELLIAAGYAPEYRQLAYEDPDLAPVRDAIEQVLSAHDPLPGARRRPPLGAGRRQPRPRHPHRGGGAAPARAAGQRAADLDAPGRGRAADPQPRQWRAHTLSRLERQWRLTGDPAVAGLIEELAESFFPADAATAAATREWAPP